MSWCLHRFWAKLTADKRIVTMREWRKRMAENGWAAAEWEMGDSAYRVMCDLIIDLTNPLLKRDRFFIPEYSNVNSYLAVKRLRWYNRWYYWCKGYDLGPAEHTMTFGRILFDNNANIQWMFEYRYSDGSGGYPVGEGFRGKWRLADLHCHERLAEAINACRP